MTDGPTEVGEPGRTDEYKALVREFTEAVLVDGDVGRIADFHRDGALAQHAPDIGDGTGALATRIAAARGGGPGPSHRRLHMVLGQGGMVLAVSEGTLAAEGAAAAPAAIYDLYRCEDGAIAEHWEVVEVIPPREQWKNGNGKF